MNDLELHLKINRIKSIHNYYKEGTCTSVEEGKEHWKRFKQDVQKLFS